VRVGSVCGCVGAVWALGGSPFKVTKPREFDLRTFDYCRLLATTEAILATTAPDLV
jgi:hypothetical protein